MHKLRNILHRQRFLDVHCLANESFIVASMDMAKQTQHSPQQLHMVLSKQARMPDVICLQNVHKKTDLAPLRAVYPYIQQSGTLVALSAQTLAKAHLMRYPCHKKCKWTTFKHPHGTFAHIFQRRPCRACTRALHRNCLNIENFFIVGVLQNIPPGAMMPFTVPNTEASEWTSYKQMPPRYFGQSTRRNKKIRDQFIVSNFNFGYQDNRSLAVSHLTAIYAYFFYGVLKTLPLSSGWQIDGEMNSTLAASNELMTLMEQDSQREKLIYWLRFVKMRNHDGPSQPSRKVLDRFQQEHNISSQWPNYALHVKYVEILWGKSTELDAFRVTLSGDFVLRCAQFKLSSQSQKSLPKNVVDSVLHELPE